jgi:nucleoid DNA-binding protein
MPTVVKQDLVQEVARNTLLSRKEVSKVLENIIETIEEHLLTGDDVALRGLGSFRLRTVRQRVLRNPSRPNEIVDVPEHCVVKFKPISRLRQAIRGVKLEQSKEAEEEE